MSKKIGCGANVTTDDKYGECIQIQGDVEERLADFLDKDMAQYNIPSDRIIFEEKKKKKAAEEWIIFKV